MPRVDVETQTITSPLMVAYSVQNTVEEITEGIRQLRNSGNEVSSNVSLRKAVEYVLGLYKKSVASFENWEEVIRFLETLPEGKIEEIEKKLKEEEKGVETEKELQSKALNSQELKELLKEYNEYRAKKTAEEIVREIQKNPLLARADQKEILRIVRRKIELEAEIKLKGIKPEKPVEPVKTEVPIVIKKYPESEPKEEMVREITNKEINERADRRIIVEERLAKNKPSNTTIEQIRKTAEKIAEVVQSNKTIDEGRKRAAGVIEDIKTEDVVFKEEVKEIIIAETAEKIVTEKVDEIVDKAVGELGKINEEQAKKIEKLIRERVEIVLAEPTRTVNEHQLIEKVIDGKKVKETGATLTEEIVKVLTGETNKIEKTEEVLEIPKQKIDKTKIEIMIRKIEAGLHEEIFRDETNENSPIDIVRADRLEEEIVERMVARGATREEAKNAAKTIRQISFPEKEPSDSRAEAVAMATMEGKNPNDGRNPEYVRQARIIKNLIKSPVRVSENVDKILKLSDKLDGVKGFDQIKTVARTIKDNPRLTRSLELIQKVVHFQDRIGGFVGGIAAKVGNFFHIPALQQWGIQLATRLGGETVGAMATQIAQFGLEGGIKNIIGQLFTTGKVVATNVGKAVAEKAATTAGTGVGIPVAAVLLATQFVLGIVKKIWNSIKGRIENGLEKIGIGSVKTKAWLQDNLGKGIGSLIYWGGGVATILIAIPAMLGAVSVAMIGWLVPGVIGGLAIMQTSTAQTASTLVAPKGTGASCVKITGQPGGGVINCDQNAPDNTIAGVDRANVIRVANNWKPGKNYAGECFNDTVNQALCAGINPTYALMIWLHESGASNYSNPETEDFGMHSIPENMNFNAQITAFLRLDPASACINDPRIGGDYWLAFSANYMNGSNCDPDLPNINGKTPREYATTLKELWSWISSEPMPNSIRVAPGGQNCGQIGNSTVNSGANSYTYVDENGDTWLCENAATENTVGYDPNAPGLTGVVVAGECSVSQKAILTKQCDPEWGSMPLNGGGTICSAGCGPTSVSMMARIKNGEMKPPVIIFSNGSAYQSMGNDGSSLQQAKQELTKLFGSTAVTYDAVTSGCDETAIARWICEGKVVMVLANFYRNSNLDLGGHFVLAVGVNGGKIVVYDPYYHTTDTPFDGTKAAGYAHSIMGCLTVEAAAIK